MPEFLQFAFSGLTVGAVYALVALGFTLIYNASDVINFAQGEFVMLGGMTTVCLGLAGVPLPLAACLAIIATVAVGLALHHFAIEPARGAGAVVLIHHRRVDFSTWRRAGGVRQALPQPAALDRWRCDPRRRRYHPAAELGGARRRSRDRRAVMGLHRAHAHRQGDG